MPSSLRRSTKYAASRSASGSGAATTRNAVPSACSSRKVCCARWRNPPNSVSSAVTNVCTSRRNWAPSTLVRALVKMPKPRRHQPRRSPRGGEQQADEAAVEEAREPLGRVEEVQRRARGRGVDDDQVVAARSDLGVAVDLPELLHRHVLLRPREGARQRLVEGVVEDLPGLLRAGLALHHLVEGALHVEHHRVERAAGPSLTGADPRHRARGVVELGDAHRLGQPAGRVDGEHHDVPPALGGPQRQGGRDRGLAHAAGAAAHDDADRRVVEEGIDVEARGRLAGLRPDAGAGPGHRVIPCSRSSPASS